MNRKVGVGRKIQRKDFLHQRFFVVGRDGQCPIIVFDRGRDVPLLGVAGTEQRDRNHRGRILLERLHAGRGRRCVVTQEDLNSGLAPPRALHGRINRERRVKIGFRLAEPAPSADGPGRDRLKPRPDSA